MEQIYILYTTLALLTSLYYYLTWNYDYWKRKGIPYVSGAIPGLGNVWQMIILRENFSDMCRRLYEITPGYSMAGFYHLRTPALLLRDPDLVKTILVTNFSSFRDNQIKLDPHLDPLLSAHPFFNNGEDWKNTRVRVTNAFSSKKLKVFLISVNSVCVKMNDYLTKTVSEQRGVAELELKELFSMYTGEVVANAIFGVEGECFKQISNQTSFKEIGDVIFEPTVPNGVAQNIVFFLPQLAKICRMGLVPRNVDNFFRSTMKDVLESRRHKSVAQNDFLQMMIEQEKNDGGNFDDTAIVSRATSFFLDVYETSSITLSFLGFVLAHYPEIQEKVREEINAVISDFERVVCYEALKKLTYMDQVLNESMRLYPAAGSLMKICTQEFRLSGSDGLSCNVEPGTDLVVPTQAFHVDPTFWPEPEKFDPDRFSEDQKRSRHRFTFLPFGEGPRVCVGMRMAVLQVKAAIVTILKNYSLEVSPQTRFPLKRDPKTLMSSAEGGLWIYLKPLTLAN